jgi:hypothetical protein
VLPAAHFKFRLVKKEEEEEEEGTKQGEQEEGEEELPYSDVVLNETPDTARRVTGPSSASLPREPKSDAEHFLYDLELEGYYQYLRKSGWTVLNRSGNFGPSSIKDDASSVSCVCNFDFF